MTRMTRLVLRGILAFGVLAGMDGARLSAQNAPARPAASAPVPVARGVRIALGHGNVDEARRVVQQSRDAATKKALRDFMGWENYDVRIRDDERIDREVLADIRKNFAAWKAKK